ncbi:MAG: glycosyltransferase family 9 protein [Bacteriovoracia bacterium]
MVNEQDDSPKVIAIKLPFDLQERILAFPFLHALSEFYPKADLHFITPKKDVEILNLLPFKAYYHLFDEDEIKSVLDVHPYTANAQIYNVDLFISLTSSFPDAALGLGLRAKKRVGFSDDWKTLLLTHKMKRPVGHHLVEVYMNLFELATGQTMDKRLRVNSRALTSIIEGEEPYIAINLAPLRGPTIEEEWVDLISQFEGQKIVLFSSDEQVRVQMLMEGFLERLPKKNTYINFKYFDWIELGRMLAHARGVLTYSGPCGAASAYVGTRTLILYENEDPQKTGPFYFLADIAVMGVNNPTLINSTTEETAIKDRVTFNMEEVFKKAVDFFGL